jgi:hypothetical protein
METITSFKILPDDYAKNILAALACPGETRLDLEKSVTKLEAALQGLAALAGEGYQPKH